MSDADRRKWNERYAEGAYATRPHPTALLVDWIDRLPAGRALDVACGGGRNSLYLAEAGRRVDAVDVSSVGLARARSAAAERGLDVNWLEADLEPGGERLPRGPYALVVVVRYVNRRLMPALLERLAPGGVLLVEQHVESDEAVAGPKSPAHRLRPGELLAAFEHAAAPADRVLSYREGIVVDPDARRAALAQLVVQRGMDA